MSWITSIWSGAKLRLIRSIVSLILGWVVAKYQGNEWYIAITPFLQMVGKYLRDKYPGSWEWLPF